MRYYESDVFININIINTKAAINSEINNTRRDNFSRSLPGGFFKKYEKESRSFGVLKNYLRVPGKFMQAKRKYWRQIAGLSINKKNRILLRFSF